MARKRKKNGKILILSLIALGILFILGLFIFKRFEPDPIDFRVTQVAKEWMPNASWSEPAETTEQSLAGQLAGFQTIAQVTSKQAIIEHPKNAREEDPTLAADGPGSSMWGYKETVGGKTQITLYSYKINPTSSNPNEPLQFNCPCTANLSVFVGKPTNSAQDDSSVSSNSLANPASVNCGKVGGTSIIKNGPNGQYGLCDFGDNMQCEEWALFRGQCPVGGVKTTGFDNIEQKYCAWVGGQTYAVPNATCKLPNGKTCSDTALYNGTCSSN